MNLLFETYQPGEFVETSRVINTPSEFAKKTLFYVQETGYLKSIKSHLHKRNNLSSYLFCIVLSGKGEFTYGEHNYTLRTNDCILLNCMEPYSHQSSQDAPWELLWVHFNGVKTGEYYEYFTQGHENSFHPEEPEKYIQLVERILTIHKVKDTYWEVFGSKLITDLLTLCIIESKNYAETNNTILDKLKLIQTYLDQNYRSKISLDQLAEDYYISKYHLCREFKRIYGVTLVNYITVKRITYAKELLRFSNKNIEEIAEACGYPDASYFNKVFQKMEGMTGSEYRRKW